jgi:hypothetical protein
LKEELPFVHRADQNPGQLLWLPDQEL